MKRTLLCRIFLAGLLTLVQPNFLTADLTVTISGVKGFNTVLDVNLQGGGTIGADDTAEIGSMVYTDLLGTSQMLPKSVLGTVLPVGTSGNVGNYASATYSSAIGERFVTPITLNNLTDSTTADARWLHLDDDDGNSNPPQGLDDVLVILDIFDDGFLEIGDEWSISGSTTMILQRGNSSDLFPGVYSYEDGSIGTVTLIVIPEPVGLPVFLVLGTALGIRRNRKSNLA